MTQNLVLAVALIGVVLRFYSRRMSAREWWILVFVALNIFLVQLQMFVGEKGNLTWILRYHQAALTILYGWTAWAVIALIRALSGRWRIGVICAGALWLVATGGTSMWRIMKHQFVESKRNAQMRAAEWAAEIIRNDWKGPLIDKERCVPIDIRIGKDYEAIIITGPNTKKSTIGIINITLTTLIFIGILFILAFILSIFLSLKYSI
jgi:hypothetical protein